MGHDALPLAFARIMSSILSKLQDYIPCGRDDQIALEEREQITGINVEQLAERGPRGVSAPITTARGEATQIQFCCVFIHE
jgi:hypothetical protein